jgi:hypothetical protein
MVHHGIWHARSFIDASILVHHDMTHHGALRHVRSFMVRHNAPLLVMAQHSTPRHECAEYSIAHHGRPRCSVAVAHHGTQHGAPRCACNTMVRHGMHATPWHDTPHHTSRHDTPHTTTHDTSRHEDATTHPNIPLSHSKGIRSHPKVTKDTAILPIKFHVFDCD